MLQEKTIFIHELASSLTHMNAQAETTLTGNCPFLEDVQQEETSAVSIFYSTSESEIQRDVIIES